MLVALFSVLVGCGSASASIHNNLAYDSPSTRVRSLGVSREGVEARHKLEKKWDYYDGQLSFPYGVASGDPCKSSHAYLRRKTPG